MSEDIEGEGGLMDAPLPQVIECLRLGTRDARSSEAAAEILRRFQPLMRKYWSWHRQGNYDDFVQETMLRLLLALPRLRDVQAFPGLFRRIVIGVAVEIYRKAGPDTEDIDEIDPDQLAVGFDEALATAVVVRSYLEFLPPRERQVVLLSFFEDRDSTYIASQMGISEGTVRNTRSRAVARLRQILLKTPKKTGE